MKLFITSLLLLVMSTQTAFAADAPWGKGKSSEKEYSPDRVVYDVAVNSVSQVERVLDRASYLSKVYNADVFRASIVIVLHGDEINFFAIKNYLKYESLMKRAQSLTVGGIIEIRMCQIAAKGHGYEPQDIHGFVQMVPMADAEIVSLQRDGYAYMQ